MSFLGTKKPLLNTWSVCPFNRPIASRSTCLIQKFSFCQVIKWFLGGKEIGERYGAVSALAFSVDSTRLLAGFARGQLMEYDMVTGRLVRDLDDVHPAGSAVVQVRYSDDASVAFISDSGGSVFEINMKRRGLRGAAGATCRCIFSGSRGEVCTLEPLRVPQTIDHPLSAFSILALATISKIIVVTVRPKLKVLITTALLGIVQSYYFVGLDVGCCQTVIPPRRMKSCVNEITNDYTTSSKAMISHKYIFLQ